MRKPILTRITSQRGYDGVLIGRDLDHIFEEGKVYGIVNIMGEYVIKELGEHAEPEVPKGSQIGAIITDGTYMLTKEEKIAQDKSWQ